MTTIVVNESDVTAVEETGTVVVSNEERVAVARDESDVVVVSNQPTIAVATRDEAVAVYVDETPILITDATVGPQGPPGAAGADGADAEERIYIQASAPVDPPATYLWIKTNVGGVPEDFEFWFEDGV